MSESQLVMTLAIASEGTILYNAALSGKLFER
jgi:hypothetical protein